YADRQEFVNYEVRAGLSTSYADRGWIENDVHSEAGSRTLDYAYDDYAVSILATLLNKADNATFFANRSRTAPFTIFNNATGFMEARNSSGIFAGPDEGWTEGDKWIYTLDVVQDVPGLIERKGGNESFVEYLDEYFGGGHNDQTNEPSHHAPYLYVFAGAASKTQSLLRQIAQENYNSTVNGLSGNDDCGQMSAWYILATLGFYPVDPVSGEFVVGSPFFDKVTIDFPSNKTLTVTSTGAPSKPYVSSVTVNGQALEQPIVRYEDVVNGGEIVFEMSDTPQPWGSATVVNGTSL
ncbi:glycoside hydrolase family 92 protein, partial [Coniophora puteana RWD-64-598 SS2]